MSLSTVFQSQCKETTHPSCTVCVSFNVFQSAWLLIQLWKLLPQYRVANFNSISVINNNPDNTSLLGQHWNLWLAQRNFVQGPTMAEFGHQWANQKSCHRWANIRPKEKNYIGPTTDSNVGLIDVHRAKVWPTLGQHLLGGPTLGHWTKWWWTA